MQVKHMCASDSSGSHVTSPALASRARVSRGQRLAIHSCGSTRAGRGEKQYPGGLWNLGRGVDSVTVSPAARPFSKESDVRPPWPGPGVEPGFSRVLTLGGEGRDLRERRFARFCVALPTKLVTSFSVVARIN